jgi:TetR/AcrR family transcriptional regulator
MSPKKSIDEADTRARILTAAAEVFASVGFTGARVDDIAERAGINKAMLYYHVGDKERLYATVLTSAVESALASLQAATQNVDTPSEKLQCVLDTFVEIGTTNRHLIPMILREVASGGATMPDEMLMRMAGVFRVVQDVLAEGMKDGSFRKTDPLLTHVTLVGSMMFLIASQPIRARLAKVAGVTHTHSLQDLADHLANIYLHGIELAQPNKKNEKPKTKKSAPRSKK